MADEFDTMELPDGTVVQVPSGMDMAAIQKAFGIGQPPAPEPFNPLKMAGEAITSAAESAVDLVTGRKEKEPGISELPGSVLSARRDGKGMMLGTALDFARDDKARADIIKKYYPNATSRQDQGGNLIFSIPQEDGTAVEGYGNRPGLSLQDLNEAFAQGLIEAPLALALRRFGPFGVGPGIAAGSVGTDLVAQSQGSDQPIDWNTAAISGVVGTVGEMLLPIDRMISYLSKRRYFDGKQLTDEGKKILADLGMDPDKATQEFVDRMKAGYVWSGDPKAAANKATLESLPVPVRGTPGDIGRSKSQQILEDAAEKGSMGKMAEAQAAGIRSRQQDALYDNLDAIGERIRGGNPNVGVQESGAIVQDALVKQRDAAQAGVNQAYDAARASTAGVAPEQVGRMSTAIRAAANERSGLPVERFSPHAKGVIDDFDEILSRSSGDVSVLLTELYDWRKQARKVASAAYGGDQYTYQAVKGALDGFDAEIKRMAADNLIGGSEDAVEAWTKALATNAEFKGTFGAKDIIGRLVAPSREGGKGVLQVAPEDASKLIFGLSNTGFANKPGMATAMVRLRDVLGPQSGEWNALRQETFGRFLQSALGQYDGDVSRRAISGARFATAFDKAMQDGKAVMSVLFSPEERALMEQFKRAALLVTQRERNTSNTAHSFANLTQKLLTLNVFGPRVMAAVSMLPAGVGDILSGIRYGVSQAMPSGRPAPAVSGLLSSAAVTPVLSDDQPSP